MKFPVITITLGVTKFAKNLKLFMEFLLDVTNGFVLYFVQSDIPNHCLVHLYYFFNVFY